MAVTALSILDDLAFHNDLHNGPAPLAAALDYAARGWNVLPLHNPQDGGRCSCGKRKCKNIGTHPRTPQGLNDATTDPAQIEQWWDQWPTANLGIATGASGLIVLDVDRTARGDDGLYDLVRLYGPLPDTVELLTGDGGRQLLFTSATTPVRTSRIPLADGVDVLVTQSYIVAPPSRHWRGQRSAWEVSSDPENVSVAPLPGWLDHYLTTRPPTQPEESIPTGRFKEELIGLAEIVCHTGRLSVLLGDDPSPRHETNSGVPSGDHDA